MSWWTDFRDTLESVAGVVANFFYPGTGVLGHWVNSKGSQQQLYGTPLGQIAMLGGGLVGGLAGNMANYGTAMDAISGGAGAGGIAGASVTADPQALQVAQQMIQNGASPAEAVQMAGISPAQAEAAGITAGAGQTWQDVAAQSGISYGGPSTGTGAASQFGPAPVGGPTGGTAGIGGAGTAFGAPAAGGTAAATGAMPWGSMGNLTTMGTGIMGLLESNQIRQAGLEASRQADPFGPYRRQFADRMQALAADPTLLTQQPGYQAGLQAVQRSGAAQGYTGSGNMMAALAKYGQDFYNQTMDRYAGYAGAGVNPGTGAGINLAGQMGGANLMMNSLGLLGKGAVMAGG